MDFSLRISDILDVVKPRTRFVVVGTLIVALLCVGAGFLRESLVSQEASKVDSAQITLYEESTDNYQFILDNMEQWKLEMEQDLTQALRYQHENPVMKINPANCTYAEIYTRFESETDWRLAVRNWIFKEDIKEIFGTDDADVLKYYNTLINFEGERGAVRVIVFDIDAYDYRKVAKKIRNLIIDGAKNNKVEIAFQDEWEKKGYSGDIQGVQNYIKDNVSRANNELNIVNGYSNSLTAPEAPELGGMTPASLIKYLLLGLFAGLVIMLFIVLVPVLKNGYLLSREQVEEMFPLDFMGDLSGDGIESVEFINASLSALDVGEDGILLIDFGKEEEGNNAISILEKYDEWTVTRGKDITSDAETLKLMKNIDDILIGVNMGHTAAQEVQKVIVRAHRLGKNVLGYVII